MSEESYTDAVNRRLAGLPDPCHATVHVDGQEKSIGRACLDPDLTGVFFPKMPERLDSLPESGTTLTLRPETGPEAILSNWRRCSSGQNHYYFDYRPA